MSSDIKIPEIVFPSGRGEKRIASLEKFAKSLKSIQSQIDFKMSSRGWCYFLEGLNLVDKGQFNKTQKLINECRKRGFLPIDFVADEQGRKFSHVIWKDDFNPLNRFKEYLNAVPRCKYWHKADFWEGEKYYVQMLVEKIDLKSLFNTLSKKYWIPIATSSGWSSISQRVEILQRYQTMHDLGYKCVLLYCGDLDPYGEAISDYLRANLLELKDAAKFDSSEENLKIERFGIDFEFIEEHNLTWIDNLITGSNKPANEKDPIVARYIKKYGRRKVEANALVRVPEAARALCEAAINVWYDKDILERYKVKRDKIIRVYELALKNTGVSKMVKDIITVVDKYLDEGYDAFEELEKIENPKSEDEEDKDDDGDDDNNQESFKIPKKAGVKLYVSAGYYIGDLVDENDNNIGYAREDGKLTDLKEKVVGWFRTNGNCYFYENEDEEHEDRERINYV